MRYWTPAIDVMATGMTEGISSDEIRNCQQGVDIFIHSLFMVCLRVAP